MPGQSRARAGEALVLIGAAGACWAVTATRMRGMDMGPGTDLGGFGWYAGVWAVMMAAMMVPSLVPAAIAHGRAVQERRPGIAPALVFALGYMLPWAAAGLLAYGLFEPPRSLHAGWLAWHEGGRAIAAAVLGAAALYELTPAKHDFLARCRRPAAPGARGSLRAGTKLGFVCVGCCWALMAGLFALGVMSVWWMVVIATLIGVERLAPSELLARRGAALVLAALAAGVLLAPAHVPGLTIPA